jgi:hypothetical protein
MMNLPSSMKSRFLAIACLAKLLCLSGCSPLSIPTRKVNVAATPAADAAYIESKVGKRFSCSFVEFDGRGDFADFDQHRSAYTTIRRLAGQGKVIVVIYCHGWKNNAHSGDVVEFNEFLSKLAAAKPGYRVHGVYLGWRGNVFRPFVSKGPDSPYEVTTKLFGEPIVSQKWQRRFYASAWLPEQFSYWSRKNAAENAVSGLPITRAIYTYAGNAKNPGGAVSGADANRVFVMGHSFGALMLEQSLLQGMVGGIMTDWSQAKGNPGPLELPFDLVLLVNSAAPSIHAKQMRDFLAADSKNRRNHGVRDGDAPVVISLTSKGDNATGWLHPVGNALSPVAPSMQRDYTTHLLKERNPDGTHAPVKQWEFYRRSPGHNPFLVNRSLVPAGSAHVANESAFGRNLDFSVADPTRFYVSSDDGTARKWAVQIKNTDSLKKTFHGKTPDPWADSSYWIVECDKTIIKDHNDIWSAKAMDTYAGLYRLAAKRRRE